MRSRIDEVGAGCGTKLLRVAAAQRRTQCKERARLAKAVVGQVAIRHDVRMDDADFGELCRSLLASLRKLATLLQSCEENDWAEWLQRNADRIEHGDAPAFDQVLSSFGGMGSLNDLVIHPMNGHSVGASELNSVNTRLQVLRSDIYSTAVAVRRELNRQ